MLKILISNIITKRFKDSDKQIVIDKVKNFKMNKEEKKDNNQDINKEE